MKCHHIIILLLLISHISLGQQDKMVLQFLSAATNAPIHNVNIVATSGELLATSGSDGYAVLPLSATVVHNYLIAFCSGYSPDTLRLPATRFYLRPLSMQLEEATVRSKQVNKILQLPNEYVVDYAFIGENILTATYSGAGGRHAKLYLVTKGGNVLTSCKLPKEPVSLFKSCIGNYYCVCPDKFYRLSILQGKIVLHEPYDISLLKGMQQCERSINGNLYYRIGNKLNFTMVYGMIDKGDSVFKPLMKLENEKVARQSFEEYMEILDLLELQKFKKAAHKQRLRTMWDKGSYGHMDIPIFCSSDSLIIFDYEKKVIRFYDVTGHSAGTVNVNFEWKSTQRFEIINDEPANRFYIHRYGNLSSQTIEELDIHTGKIMSIVRLDYPFTEQVRVFDGAVYFLWQDSHGGSTRQLFVQNIR